MVRIRVSPGTLSRTSTGTWLTVGAEVPYGEVEVDTVYLNGFIPAAWLRESETGGLVAAFPLEDVMRIVLAGRVDLRLEGATTDGDCFWGVDTIRVIDAGRKRKKPQGQ